MPVTVTATLRSHLPAKLPRFFASEVEPRDLSRADLEEVLSYRGHVSADNVEAVDSALQRWIVTCLGRIHDPDGVARLREDCSNAIAWLPAGEEQFAKYHLRWDGFRALLKAKLEDNCAAAHNDYFAVRTMLMHMRRNIGRGPHRASYIGAQVLPSAPSFGLWILESSQLVHVRHVQGVPLVYFPMLPPSTKLDGEAAMTCLMRSLAGTEHDPFSQPAL